MLSQKETEALLLEAKQGDNKAKEKLIEENSPLIKAVIRRYRDKGVDYDDLYQLGSMGFLKAIMGFNHSFGVKFSTYAVPMILGEVKRFLRDDGSIKISRTIKSQNNKIQRYIAESQRETGVKPSVEQISQEFSLDPSDVVFIMDSGRPPLSLQAPAGDDNERGTCLIDRLCQNDDHEQMEANLILKQAFSSLKPREKTILLMRFFRDRTQSEIAKTLGISQVQVSRLECKILEKLREVLVVKAE